MRDWGGGSSRFSFVAIHFAVILVVKSNVLPFLISGQERWLMAGWLAILNAFYTKFLYKVLGLNWTY
jgi:hypothetical protein